jgi:glutamate carboxypeptidase
LLEALDHAGEAMVARAEAWSAINSGSLELAGLARMRAPLAEALADLPGAVEEAALAPSQRVRPDGEVIDIEHGASLRLKVRPDAPIQVAMTGHYDTVFPAAHAFQAPWREGEVLRGPGVADMKGGIAVMLAALAAFERLPGEKRVGYEVLLSPDEEIGSLSSAVLLADLGKRAHLGLTYEPALADGALVDARKGSANYSLALRGRAAHAGGSAVNVVPERAVLRFNVRVPDAESAAWAEAEVHAVAAAAGARDGISAHLHGGFTRPPKPLNDQQRTMASWTHRAGEALGLDLKFQASGGVCEGNNLAAAGCPNIDTLGPCGGGLHSDQEFALIPSFAERAKLSFLMLAGVERGLFDVKSLKS